MNPIGNRFIYSSAHDIDDVVPDSESVTCSPDSNLPDVAGRNHDARQDWNGGRQLPNPGGFERRRQRSGDAIHSIQRP